LGLPLDDLLSLPQGEVTFAVVEKPSRKLAALLLVDTGENEETVATLLDKMDGALKEAGAEPATQQAGDIELQIYKLPDTDENPIKNLVYFQAEGYLVFSTEVAALKSVLELWEGEGDSFADNATFSYIVDQCSTADQAPRLKWYVNPMGLLQAGVGMVQAQNPQAGLVLGILPILGLDRLKAIGGGTDVNVGDFASVSKTFVYAEQPTSGLLNLFTFPAKDVTAPPKWVQATVDGYADINWDAAEAYAAVEAVVDSFQGPGAFGKIVDALQADGTLPFHLKEDLIDQLTGRLQFITDGADDAAEAVQFPKMTFVAGLKDAAAMQSTLAKIAEVDDFPATSRKFAGTTLYEIEGQGENQPTVSATVANGNLIIATATPLMEQLLQPTTGPSLADSPAYRRIAKFFPKQASSVGYANQGPQFKGLYDMLQNLDDDALEGFDLSTLPPWESLEKYFSPTGSYMVPDKNGALTVNFGLPRERSK
jgi:hypothetical protein